MSKIVKIDREAPVNCVHCGKEILPYYIEINKPVKPPILKILNRPYIYVDICGCPECHKVFIIERN
jgi:hypothetical protein